MQILASFIRQLFTLRSDLTELYVQAQVISMQQEYELLRTMAERRYPFL
jgi:hypothetical protein